MNISEPLIHTSESDWLVTQIDIGFDISLHPQVKFNGSLQIKQLERVHNIYPKLLPYKGSCLRLEENISFPSSSPAPTLSSLSKTVIPPTPEQIIDALFGYPSSDSFAKYSIINRITILLLASKKIWNNNLIKKRLYSDIIIEY